MNYVVISTMAQAITVIVLLMLLGTKGNPDIDSKSTWLEINQRLSQTYYPLPNLSKINKFTEDNQGETEQNEKTTQNDVHAQTASVSNTLGNYIPSGCTTRSSCRIPDSAPIKEYSYATNAKRTIREKRDTSGAYDKVSVVGGEQQTVILECPVDIGEFKDVRWFKDLPIYGVTQLTLNANITAIRAPFDASKYAVNGTFSLHVKDVNKGDAGRYWCINGDTNGTIHDAHLVIIRYRTCPESPRRILKGMEFRLECGTSFWGARDESNFPTVKWYEDNDDVTSTFSNEISNHTSQSIATYMYTADTVGTSIATCTINVPSGLVETQICNVELQVTEYADTIWISTDSSSIDSDIYTLKEDFLSNRKPVYTSSSGFYLFSVCLDGQAMWYISDTFPSDPNVYLARAETNENVPVDIMSYWSNPAGSIVDVDIYPYLFDKIPCDTLFVSGPSDPSLLGLYFFSKQFSNGRPVYTHEQNKGYLYHNSDYWYIGEDINVVPGIYSVASFAGTPDAITEIWNSTTNINVQCLQEATSTCTNISLTGVQTSTIDTKYAGLYEAMGIVSNRASFKHKTKDYYIYYMYVPIAHWILADAPVEADIVNILARSASVDIHVTTITGWIFKDGNMSSYEEVASFQCTPSTPPCDKLHLTADIDPDQLLSQTEWFGIYTLTNETSDGRPVYTLDEPGTVQRTVKLYHVTTLLSSYWSVGDAEPYIRIRDGAFYPELINPGSLREELNNSTWVEISTMRFLCFKEQDPCETLYLDSSTYMPAGVMTSGANIFGIWVLDETQTYNNRPVYHHQYHSNLYLFKVHPIGWVLHFESPTNIPVDNLPINPLAMITDQSVYPEDITAPIRINQVGGYNEWPGAAFSCFSVSTTCNEISISGISTSPFEVFNGVYSKIKLGTVLRPSYEYYDTDNNRLILTFGWQWAPDSSGRLVPAWQLYYNSYRQLANFVYEVVVDPANIRFNWTNTPMMEVTCVDELIVSATESKQDENCHMLYLSGEYGAIDYTPNLIRWYGYYFNNGSEVTQVYTHESEMRALKRGANNTWEITDVDDYTGETRELSVIDAARSPDLIQNLLWDDGTENVISRIFCVPYIDEYMCATLLLDAVSDERFTYLHGIYTTTDTTRLNHRPAYQWRRDIHGKRSDEESLYLYFLSGTSEWVIGTTLGDEEDDVICRVVDPVDDPTLISRKWNCFDATTNTTVPVELLQFVYHDEDFPDTTAVPSTESMITTEISTNVTIQPTEGWTTESEFSEPGLAFCVRKCKNGERIAYLLASTLQEIKMFTSCW